MDRKELYKKIKNYNLEEAIKTKFGRNFTQVSSKDLEEIIAKVEDADVCTSVKHDCSMTRKLIEVLQKKRILLPSEVNYILGEC